METATVTVEGDRQTVRLPKSVHLPSTVFVRQDGDTVVLETAKRKTWPEGFFDSIHVTDSATTAEAVEVLMERLPASKVVCLLSSWKIG